jgi:hypothetical protein
MSSAVAHVEVVHTDWEKKLCWEPFKAVVDSSELGKNASQLEGGAGLSGGSQQGSGLLSCLGESSNQILHEHGSAEQPEPGLEYQEQQSGGEKESSAGNAISGTNWIDQMQSSFQVFFWDSKD